MFLSFQLLLIKFTQFLWGCLLLLSLFINIAIRFVFFPVFFMAWFLQYCKSFFFSFYSRLNDIVVVGEREKCKEKTKRPENYFRIKLCFSITSAKLTSRRRHHFRLKGVESETEKKNGYLSKTNRNEQWTWIKTPSTIQIFVLLAGGGGGESEEKHEKKKRRYMC